MEKKWSWEKAAALALHKTGLLVPFCDRVKVAGSIRRKCREVGDIEIVCLPKAKIARDLFEVPIKEFYPIDGFYFGQWGVVQKDGPRYKQIALKEGINLDLFIVRPPATWGIIFALRTGDAEFSKLCVKSKSFGGFLPVGYRVQNGQLWGNGGVIPTPEEADFLEVLGLSHLKPEQRSGYRVHY